MYTILLRKTRRHVNTIERFYVYKETKNKNKWNKIFGQYKNIVFRVSASIVPATSSRIVIVKKKTHKKAYVYVQKSVSFGKNV